MRQKPGRTKGSLERERGVFIDLPGVDLNGRLSDKTSQ